MSCCCQKPEPRKESSCCSSQKGRPDWLFGICLGVTAAAYLTHVVVHAPAAAVPFLGPFVHGVYSLMNKMWWGIAAGILAVGLLGNVPREFVTSILGPGGRFTGILRACGAGLLLDLCNHGILLVGMKLYERGASLGQVFAFLIASPWNSLSLTLILIALIGWKWTLAFIGFSVVIALISGMIFHLLVRARVLPDNPNTIDLPDGFQFFPEAKQRLRDTKFDSAFCRSAAKSAWSESGMILRWIFFGTVLAAGLRASLNPELFGAWFGPTIGGLGLTLLIATVIEVCSEGSSPIAADLLNRAAAPGNAFTFLMAGVATDYTEILSLRETTKSWKIALFLPLVTVPQILVIGWLINSLASPA